MRKSAILLVMFALAGFVAPAASASEIRADLAAFDTPMTAGETRVLDVILFLDETTNEAVSVAEFDLVVEGTDFADISFEVGDAGWTGTRLSNDRGNGRTSFSLLMDASDTNRSDDALLVAITIAALDPQPGAGPNFVNIFLNDFVGSADLDVPPFFEILLPDVANDNRRGPAPDNLIASIQIGEEDVPEPATLLLVGIGAVALLRRRIG